MKVKLVTYAHPSNGISVAVTAETDAEEKLLNAIWTDGKMEIGAGHSDRGTGCSYLVTAFDKEQADE